jgi:hypothetical protein
MIVILILLRVKKKKVISNKLYHLATATIRHLFVAPIASIFSSPASLTVAYQLALELKCITF